MAACIRSMGHAVIRFGQSSFLVTGHSSHVVNAKRYVRALKRKPVKVIYPDGKEETLAKSNVNQTPGHQRATLNAKKNSKDATEDRTKLGLRGRTTFQSKDTQEKISNESRPLSKVELMDGLRFEKALPDDKRLSKLVTVARSRAYREHQGKILLEGRRLICDALVAGAKPQTLFFSSIERLRELPVDKLKRANLIKVKFEDVKKWSELIAPQGVIGIFSRPDVDQLAFPKEHRDQSVPLSLICDNIRDPGNLGTILRCAAAAGCHSVLLSKGCVDVWEPKVLRAAMGAHFRLPIFPSLTWEEVSDHLPQDVTVHVADNCSSPIRDVDTQSSLRKPSDYGWVSSRREKKRHSVQDVSESDSESDTDSDHEVDEVPRVEPKQYHDPWAQRSTALVIGGETRGLSLESLRLAQQTDGRRLFVPLAHGVDSLNSAMAASILLFEGRRQLLKLLERSGRRLRN
ncbi:rRNA methyltransferase 3A, mitochondrial [Alosa sapidissima]|uniref:rRNA methyltransferase 3A, mitochondrial n=1 Tax=Alosa sapidissima TaxID=34773 RepID=UPI001C085EF9|nr:rRNA methyltransferase 3A, mitochondrial [Alosa sapidissima]